MMAEIKTEKQTLKILRLIVLIWGGISLAFLVIMVGEHVANAHITADGAGEFDLNSTSELVAFILFPVSAMIGLAISWKWEGFGGLFTILAMIDFHAALPSGFVPLIDAFMASGILFHVYWLLL